MVGFASGVAVLIILGQLGDFTGYYSLQNNKVLQMADLLLHGYLIVPQAVAVGLTTIGLILIFEHSRFRLVRSLALFVAMGVASMLPVFFSWSMVETVQDVADIPQSLPQVVLPDLKLMPEVAVSAVALGLLGLVQGASVAQMYPNPDGKFSTTSRDFLGQGLANLATSFFQGIPAGGSTSSTAIVVNAGAQTRWANIFGGIWVTVIVLLIGNLAERVAMPALAGLLIVVGVRMLNPKAIASVWQTGPMPRVSAIITFAAALIVPLQAAIIVGVIVAVLLHVFRQAQKVILVEFVWSDKTFPEERPAPKELPSNDITALHVYGSLFFAAAGTFEKLLPSAENAKRAVVILVLRGHSEVGSTFINALTRYSAQLAANQGRLMLVGISDTIYTQLQKTGAIQEIGAENLFPAEVRVGAAMQKAYDAALAWLGKEPSQNPPSNEEQMATTPESRSAAGDEDVRSLRTSTPADGAPAVATERLLYLDELERLAALKEKGVVTEEEFTAKKHHILGL
jgi:SulP family sulfate permease